MSEKVSASDIINASNKLRKTDMVIKTPLIKCNRLSNKYNCNIYLKREDLQSVRSFKVRGALWKIMNLSKNAQQRGVVCASAGNHAQGVAYSCSNLGIKCKIFVPIITPLQKINRIKKFLSDDGKLIVVGKTFDNTLLNAQNYCSKKNMTFIHPYDDYDVITGQGTISVEIFEDIDPDIIICGIGGGGLISGITAHSKHVKNNILIFGGEPIGSPSFMETFVFGEYRKIDVTDTFVDGASVGNPGKKCIEVSNDLIDKIVLVDNNLVSKELLELYDNEGIIAEPAGGLPICVLDRLPNNILYGKNVVCVLSGGNNDYTRYTEIINNYMIGYSMRFYLIIKFNQIPGQLKKFVEKVLTSDDDIIRFEYTKKSNIETGPALIGLDLGKSNNRENLERLLIENDFEYKILEPSDPEYALLV